MTTPSISPNAVDLQGLSDLRRRAAHDESGALAEAAVQFEALFIGMMLDSARSASLGSGMFDGPETQQYLELMDRQVALEMARNGGFGFGKLLLEQLGAPSVTQEVHARRPLESPRPASAVEPPLPASASAEFPHGLPQSLAALAAAPVRDAEAPAARSGAADGFVAELLPAAHEAAAKLGVEPKLLLAQAALETGWGGAVPQRPDGSSAHNVFGMKAGSTWRGDRVAHWTLEHDGEVAARKREVFRAYPDPAASFADYVNLISNTPRYAQALANAKDPEAYARAVSAAGYATDPAYADKWLAIYRGERLGGALDGFDPLPSGPTRE